MGRARIRIRFSVRDRGEKVDGVEDRWWTTDGDCWRRGLEGGPKNFVIRFGSDMDPDLFN